ncbi:MAG: hypothetical protein K6G75_04200 [Lachnospiraceae bacterium]|nr:hypothetical protein [Lachnospiraceae bacterium]
MNRRKITGIIAVLLSGILLTGCVVTPPEMRDEDTGIDQVSVPKDPVKDNTETEAGPSETDISIIAVRAEQCIHVTENSI